MLSPVELEELAELLAAKVAERLANQKRLVDRVELSQIVGLSVPTIDRRVRAGVIPAIRTGGRVLFDVSAVVGALSNATDTPIAKQQTGSNGEPGRPTPCEL